MRLRVRSNRGADSRSLRIGTGVRERPGTGADLAIALLVVTARLRELVDLKCFDRRRWGKFLIALDCRANSFIARAARLVRMSPGIDIRDGVMETKGSDARETKSAEGRIQ